MNETRTLYICDRCRNAYPSTVSGGSCRCGGDIIAVEMGSVAVGEQIELPLTPDPRVQPRLL